MNVSTRRFTRDGLTLLELVVALGILALLSTIAVGSLEPLADQTRYEVTQRLLDDLREATVGADSARQINGQRIISGFIADAGSEPIALAEFTTQPVRLISRTVQSFDSDRDTVNDVTLTSGWNGPYLTLGAGQDSLIDGWGRAPMINPDGGELEFVSQGSDGDSIAPEDNYLADLSVSVPTVDYQSDVTFRLFSIDGPTGLRIDPAPTAGQQLAVIFYGVNANGGTDGSIEEVTLPIASTGTFEASRTAVVHGTVAARGVLWSDTDADDVLDIGETVLESSYVHYLLITSGSAPRVEMELR